MQTIFNIRILIVIIFTILMACSSPKNQETYISGPTMGTTYNVKFVSVDGVEQQKLKREIDQSLLNINQLMSTYIKDSELSRFNQWRSVEPFLCQHKLWMY